MADQAEVKETNSERFARILKERAAEIKCVRNDVFTTQLWQIALNFVLGAGALALLIVSMIPSVPYSVLYMLLGIAFVLILIVYNMFIRSVLPTSFLMYTHIADGARYTFMIISKKRFGFSDGVHHIEVERGEAVMLQKMTCGRYVFDFFKDMDTDVRIVKGDKEMFKGHCKFEGKTYKCKIVFRNGEPLYGTVGGGRIKYFDVNDIKDKFIVPSELKKGVRSLGVDFPKVPGVFVRNDISDPKKQ